MRYVSHGISNNISVWIANVAVATLTTPKHMFEQVDNILHLSKTKPKLCISNKQTLTTDLYSYVYFKFSVHSF